MIRALPRILFVLVLALATSAIACEGCRSTSGSAPGSQPASSSPKGPNGGSVPSVRLYLVSDLAGALEPCGCTKDQLGGLDHVAAWMSSERAAAPNAMLVTAGPLFFMDAHLAPDKAGQDTTKAETLAAALDKLAFAAFAPAENDFAAGTPELGKLRAASGAAMLFANAGAPVDGATSLSVRDAGGVKVALIGVSSPNVPGVEARAPVDAVKAQVAAAKGQGAKIVIALASVGRGEAKRIADAAPELTAVLVGSTGGSGEANTTAPPPERVGDVLIAETGNHLQTVGVLDLYVRGEPTARGTLSFADGTGLELGMKREELTRRIDELHVKIAVWEKDGKVQKADLDARRADLAKLEADRRALDAPRPPPEGSFFRYATKEIRTSLGEDPALGELLDAYYRKVNDANKEAFASRVPRPPAKGEPSYVGVEACTACHEDPRAVWDKTRHAKAYETLASQHKEYNLDCVSCHVTGYDRPGGSTVTHVDKLESVQCEVCHGPGSAHTKAKHPESVPMPIAKPGPDSCLQCHHPPHVESFDAKAKMAEILGPGHGQP